MPGRSELVEIMDVPPISTLRPRKTNLGAEARQSSLRLNQQKAIEPFHALHPVRARSSKMIGARGCRGLIQHEREGEIDKKTDKR